MKKMMVAFAVVALAMASGAATLSWSIVAGSWQTGVTKPGAGALYYAVLTDTATSGTLATALASGEKDKIQAALNGLAANSYSTGKFASAASTGNGSFKSDSILDKDSYTATIIAFDAGTIADANNFFVSVASAAGTGYIPPDTTYTTAQWKSSGTKMNGTWSEFKDVPEPTSAMLLLLGVAGLALRRRRA